MSAALRPSLSLLASVALLACALGGCKHPGERLEGHWHGVKAEGVGSDQQTAANAFAVGTELDFKAGVLTVHTPQADQAGKYKVTKEDKQSVTVTTDKDGPSDPVTFVFPDDKTMRWVVIDGKTIDFSKD